jgi:outer membrane protein TolC
MMKAESKTADARRRWSQVLTIMVATVLMAGVGVDGSELDDLSALVTRLEAGFESAEPMGELLTGASDLETVLIIAEQNSPSLKAAFYDFKAAVQKAGYAGAWGDPKFSWGYFIENVETRVGPQEHRLSLSQPLKWPGKLAADSDMAHEAAKAAYRRFQSERLQLAYRVKQAYYEFYLLGREAELTRESRELLRFWETVVRTRYKVGLQKHPDLIKAQVELGLLDDRLTDLLDQHKPAAALLLSELKQPATTQLPPPGRLEVTIQTFDEDNVLSRIVRNNPSLLALDHLIESERARMRLAGRAAYPDFNIGLTYIATGEAANPLMDESGKDPWMINVGVSLPLWFGQNSAKKQEAQARHRAAQYRRETSVERLIAEVSRLLYDYRQAGRQVELYRDLLLPQTEQLINATFTSYQAGESDFLSLLAAQRQLLDFQLALDRALVTAAVKEAYVHMLGGYENKQ